MKRENVTVLLLVVAFVVIVGGSWFGSRANSILCTRSGGIGGHVYDSSDRLVTILPTMPPVEEGSC